MALSITSIQRENGQTCEHRVCRVDHEGVTRVIHFTLADIDALIEREGAEEFLRQLVMRWVAYRRRQNRAFTATEIA